MANCNIPNCNFQGPKSRKVEFQFDGGDISSDGGQLFILYRQLTNLHIKQSWNGIIS